MAKETNTQEAQEQEKALHEFNWDEDTDFNFDTPTAEAEEEEEEEVITPEKKEKKAQKDTEEEEGEESEEDLDFNFDDDSEEEEETEELEGTAYSELTSKMKESGLFSMVEIPEDEEIDEEKFFELHDQEIEARVDEALSGWAEELDEDGKAFIKFKKDGGKTEDFFKVYGSKGTKPKGDLEDEAYQEKLSRYYFKEVEKLDADDIEDRIEWLKDSGKLAKYAEKHDEKITELEEQEREQLADKAKNDAKAREKAQEDFVQAVEKTLESTSEVGNFKFSPQLKKKLLPFMTKPTVKVGKNAYITGVQDKLRSALKDPEKMLILSKLLYSDFDVTDIVKSAQTTQTRKVKKNLQRTKNNKPSSSGKGNTRKSLAEFF